MDTKLRKDIQSALQSIAASTPVLSSKVRADKLYEIFILTCIVRALRLLNVQMEFKDSSDNPTRNIIFRLGPGLIYNPSSSPGFVHFSYQGREYEIQNSIRVLGVSNVLHELDICIISREEADKCRRNQINPKQSTIKMIAECKYYGASLPLHLGREYLGLGKEFGIRIKTLVSNQGSEEIHSLITKHKGTENFNISPLNPENIETFVRWLANELRQVL